MLLGRYAFLATALTLGPGSAWCDTGSEPGDPDNRSARAIEFNFAQYQVAPANVTKAAIYALLVHGWEIQKIDATSVVGIIGDDSENQSYEVRIAFDASPKIQIELTRGPQAKPKWLSYIKTDMVLAMLSCVK